MPEELILFIALGGVLITVGTIVGSVVWTVATIKSEGKSNRIVSNSLTKEITKLTGAVERLDDKVDGHNDRIIRLEERRPA